MSHSVVLLAADTARSQAYAQALSTAGIDLSRVVVFGSPGQGLPGQPSGDLQGSGSTGLFLPDLAIPLEETCAGAGWPLSRLACHNVNDPLVEKLLVELSPGLVIYSGYGSQIVGPSLLRLGPPFLHVHSGWLPAYRGSTTLYYSWLETGTCGVSAFLLDVGIDTGPVVGRKIYPTPPPGIDVDYVYDSAIRADLLAEVMMAYTECGRFPSLASQEEQEEKGRTYYVIHPVLKHIALLGTSHSAPKSDTKDLRKK